MINTFSSTHRIFADTSSANSLNIGNETTLSDYMFNNPSGSSTQGQETSFASLLEGRVDEQKQETSAYQKQREQTRENEKNHESLQSQNRQEEAAKQKSFAEESTQKTNNRNEKSSSEQASLTKGVAAAESSLSRKSKTEKDNSAHEEQALADKKLAKNKKSNTTENKKSLEEGIHASASAFSRAIADAKNLAQASTSENSHIVQEDSQQLSSQKFLMALRETLGLKKPVLSSLSQAQSGGVLKDEKLLLLSNSDALKKLMRDVLADGKDLRSNGLAAKKVGAELSSLLQEKTMSSLKGKSGKLKSKLAPKTKDANTDGNLWVKGQNDSPNSSAQAALGGRLHVSRETSSYQEQNPLSQSRAFAQYKALEKSESSSSFQRHSAGSDNAFGGQSNAQQAFLSDKIFSGNAAQRAEAFRSPLMQKQFEAIMQRARLNIKENGNARFSTSMYPAELGKVSVYLSMTDGVLSGRFTVENDLVRAQLMEHLHNLSETLQQEGFNLAGFEVDVNDGSRQAFTQDNKDASAPSSLQKGVSSAGEEFDKQQSADNSKKQGGTYA